MSLAGTALFRVEMVDEDSPTNTIRSIVGVMVYIDGVQQHSSVEPSRPSADDSDLHRCILGVRDHGVVGKVRVVHELPEESRARILGSQLPIGADGFGDFDRDSDGGRSEVT